VLNDASRGDDGRELFKGNGGYYTTRGGDGQLYEAVRWGSGDSYVTNRGDTVSQHSMLYSDDLTIHEITHGVIKAETGDIGGSADERGAVNEALADIMAASATRDWRLGEGMYTAESDRKVLRNIAQPDDPTAVHTLYTSMQEIRDSYARNDFEEHYASGVISHTAARIQQRIGGERGWQAVEAVAYRAINDGRLGRMSFTDAANAIRWAAYDEFGNDDRYRIVWEELQRAGL
jgi:Zn-dependent metalloprotease